MVKVSLLDRLTPKNIILDALKSKLEPEGISKIVIIFITDTDDYNVMLSKEGGGNIKLELTEKEVSLIKKLLLSKIKDKFEEQSNKEINSIIIEFDLKNTEFKVFIEDKRKEVTKLNF